MPPRRSDPAKVMPLERHGRSLSGHGSPPLTRREPAQRRRWRLYFSSLSNAVTGTRDMQPALQRPRQSRHTPISIPSLHRRLRLPLRYETSHPFRCLFDCERTPALKAIGPEADEEISVKPLQPLDYRQDQLGGSDNFPSQIDRFYIFKHLSHQFSQRSERVAHRKLHRRLR